MSVDPRDLYEQGAVSDCCEAPVYLGDLCSLCGEHCGKVEFDEDGNEIITTP